MPVDGELLVSNIKVEYSVFQKPTMQRQNTSHMNSTPAIVQNMIIFYLIIQVFGIIHLAMFIASPIFGHFLPRLGLRRVFSFGVILIKIKIKIKKRKAKSCKTRITELV